MPAPPARLSPLLLLLLQLQLPATAWAQTPVVLSNTALRRDTQGRVVNAHDGNLYVFGGKFWLYGTVYEDCVQAGPVCDGRCGYYGNLFAAYSSPDLQTWTLESPNVLPALTRDNSAISYWELNVGYNPLTSMYVALWWSGHFGFVNSSVAVAVSPSPAGPFVPTAPIAMKGASVISDTVALFVDADGQAYARYNTRDAPLRHVVERLAPDWLSSTGETAIIFEKQDFPWYDGGGMFVRGGTYYVMLSFDCCFCSWGSDALVFTAPSPLGPWAPQAAPAPRALAGAAASLLSLSLPPSGAAAAAAMAATQEPPRAVGGAPCNFTGPWSGVLGGQPVGPPNLELAEDGAAIRVSGAVATDAIFHAENASLVFPDFPGYGLLVGRVSAFAGSGDACSRIDWVDYSPANSFWCRHPDCTVAPVPPANWTNEVNACADGRNPPEGVADMHINPCSQNNAYGLNFTIPAQQFGVAVLPGVSATPGGERTVFMYFGEHFKSSADGLKSHDLQSWIPLSFDGAGRIVEMRNLDNFTLYLH